MREEILDASEHLLVEKGHEDAVSIRDIAAAVGVSPPAIYLHFPDKETLIFAICERQFAILDARLQDALVGIDDPLDALRRGGEEYVNFGLEHPDAYRIMFMGHPAMEGRHAELVERTGLCMFQHLVDAVQRAIDGGALRSDVDAVDGAIFLWTGMHGLTSLLISLRDFPWPDRDDMAGQFRELQLRALARE